MDLVLRWLIWWKSISLQVKQHNFSCLKEFICKVPCVLQLIFTFVNCWNRYKTTRCSESWRYRSSRGEGWGVSQFSIIEVLCNRNRIKLYWMKYKMQGLITTVLLKVGGDQFKNWEPCVLRSCDGLSAAISIPLQGKEMWSHAAWGQRERLRVLNGPGKAHNE